MKKLDKAIDSILDAIVSTPFVVCSGILAFVYFGRLILIAYLKSRGA